MVVRDYPPSQETLLVWATIVRPAPGLRWLSSGFLFAVLINAWVYVEAHQWAGWFDLRVTMSFINRI